MKTFRSSDGVHWRVDAVLPGSSNVMILFRHPDGDNARLDRYNWFISRGPESRSVTSRLSPERVMEKLDDAMIARLFARSMPVSRPADESHLSLGLGGAAAGLSAGIGRIRS
jgi:hypothetical protein